MKTEIATERVECPTCAAEMDIRIASFVTGERYAVVVRTYHPALERWREAKKRGQVITEEQARSPDPVMPQVSPFHSVKPNTPQVHHDNNKCTEGNNIEAENKRSGTGGRPKCSHCTKLDSEGK